MRLRYLVKVQPGPWTLPLDPLLIAGVATVGTLAAMAMRWSRAHGRAGFWRTHGGWIATLVLALAWLSPLQTLASHYLLTAHLAQITMVMGVTPPLLLLALPDRPVLHLPRALRGACRVLVHPVAGMIAVNAAFFGWHAGVAYDASLRSPWVYDAQQLSLLLASVVFWWSITVPIGDRRVLGRWATLGYIFVATIPQTFAGITVALAHHTLYPAYGLAPHVFGLSTLTDQQVAGACIALVTKIALFTAFGVVFMRMLGETPVDGEDDGGGGGRRRPTADQPRPSPSGGVPWLADVNAGRTVPEPAPLPRRLRVPAGAGPHPG